MESVLKTFIGRIVLVTVFLAFCWVAYQLFGYTRLSHRVNSRIAELRAAGSPTSISDLARTDLPKSEAFGKILELETTLNKIDLAIYRAMPQVENPSESEQQKAEAEIDKIFAEFVDRHPTIIEQLREAATLPPGSSWTDFSLPTVEVTESSMDKIGSYSAATRLLVTDANYQLRAGNSDEAAMDALALLRWSDQIAIEPGLVYLLKCHAIEQENLDIAARVISSDELTESTRNELIALLKAKDFASAWKKALASERAIGLTMMDDLPGPTNALPSFLQEKLTYLDMIEEQQAVADSWGIHPIGTSNTGGVLVGTVIPAIETSFEAFRRVQAKAHAVIVLNAWIHAGKTKVFKLETLDVDPRFKIDPFTGDEMNVAATDSGVTIYSVGINLLDDGGELENEIDVGIHVDR